MVVTGTQGKTTTASLLAWVLESGGRDPSFFVGGIPVNFGQGIKRGMGPEVVLEGDEYDTAFFDKRPKFLHYLPDTVIINNIEFDHADIYRDLREIERAFINLQRLVPRNGLIIANTDESRVRHVVSESPCRVDWFGSVDTAPWRVSDVGAEGDATRFSLWHKDRLIDRFRLALMGAHNAMNGAAVYVACRFLDVSHEQITAGFETFQGVRRRLERRGTYGGVTVFDDFAHHPTAIRKTLAAMRLHYPGRSLWVAFEPRTNTMRRNLFQEELPGAFAGASTVMIGPIYRGNRIDPADRLDTDKLTRSIEQETSARACHMDDVNVIARFLCDHVRSGDIVVVMSSGDFGGLTDKVIQGLRDST